MNRLAALPEMMQELLRDMGALRSVDRHGVNWAGRAVTVIGLGRSGAAACRLLVQLGCRVTATEAHDSEALRSVAHQLEAEGAQRIELGRHSREGFEGCDTVVVSPGVPESSDPVRWANELGVPIMSEIELAFRFCPCPVVAVTGTNGKSSVVTMIQRVLQAAGRRAIACGNLGTPFSSIVEQLSAETTVVVEVSSFQLLGCTQFRPAVAVLLNLGTNHLDRHADHEHYAAAKARLFARQTPEDYAVLNARDAAVMALSRSIRARHVWFGAPGGPAPAYALSPATCARLSENAQAVLQVGRVLGIPDPLTYQAIREFRGLEHRLEDLGRIRGVRVVNDSKSTTPESLLHALTRCPGPVVAILGGRDKGLDFSALPPALADPRIRGVVLIGESRVKLRALLRGETPVRECSSLEDAMDAALAFSRPGDTVLFSPACASFDMFRDFEDRGAQFKRLVRRLQGAGQ